MSDQEDRKTVEPLVSIPLTSGGKLEPVSVDELEGWLRRERESWKWVELARNSDRQIDYIFNSLNISEKTITRTIGDLRSPELPAEGLQSLVKEKTAWLIQRYRDGALVADSPAGKFVSDLVLTSPGVVYEGSSDRGFFEPLEP